VFIGEDKEEDGDEIVVSTPPTQAKSAKSTQGAAEAPPNPLPTPESTPDPLMQNAQATQLISTANSALAPPPATTPFIENQSDFSTENILLEGSKRFRTSTQRQNYTAALTQTSEHAQFHAAFALRREKGAGAKWALHRDTLPAEPRT
jgi:hypothetical protein